MNANESKFKFKSPTLTKLIYKLNSDYNKTKDSLELSINTHTEISKNINNASVSLNLKIFDNELLEKNEAPFFIDITMKGFFGWDENIDENFLKALLENNAPAILLSYIRPYISTITVGSGYPPLILPLLDFTKNSVEYVKQVI